MSVTFSLPKPVTLSKAFNNHAGQGRIKSREYRAWQKAALWELQIQQVAKFAPKPPVQMTLTVPYQGNGDVCNLEKVVTDTLVEAGVIPNDSMKYLQRVTVQTGSPDKTKCFVTVEAMEAV